jgi:hypothetical protein
MYFDTGKTSEDWEALQKRVAKLEAENEVLRQPLGDVGILLKGLEHIGKWEEEEAERWDDPGYCALDTLAQYRYSMSVRKK